MIALTVDTMVWIAVRPAGVSRVKVRFGSAQLADLPDSDSAEGRAFRDAVKLRFDLINGEDRGIVTTVQKGVVARRAGRGWLSNLERPIWEFNRYLARRLADAQV